jgi:hypothetical protein
LPSLVVTYQWLIESETVICPRCYDAGVIVEMVLPEDTGLLECPNCRYFEELADTACQLVRQEELAHEAPGLPAGRINEKAVETSGGATDKSARAAGITHQRQLGPAL